MKYALWNLKLEADGYYSGPEQLIYEAGGLAEGSWASNSVENNGKILGYVSGDFDLDLSAWNYQEITAEDALLFCQAINESAYFTEDGRVAIPVS